MKRLLALLLLAAPAFGASYTVVTTAAHETVITRERLYDNAQACAKVSLPSTCTQAQADAKQAGFVTIYATNNVYVLGGVLKAWYTTAKGRQTSEDQATWSAWLAGATQAQKDAICVSVGLVAGCLP